MFRDFIPVVSVDEPLMDELLSIDENEDELQDEEEDDDKEHEEWVKKTII